MTLFSRNRPPVLDTSEVTTDEDKLRADLAWLQANLVDIPRENAREMVSEFSACSRRRPDDGAVSFFALTDGVAALFTTSEFLEFRSHRFIIPDEGEDLRYHREPFNIDIQKIGSSTLNLAGIEQVAACEDAVDGLQIVRSSVESVVRADGRWVSMSHRHEYVVQC